MVAHRIELDELLFSSFFVDHGNNNEAKSLSSNLDGKQNRIFADVKDKGFQALSDVIFKGNIDEINNSNAYFIRCYASDLSGTLPITVLGGNSFILMGFSAITSNSKVMYGIQLAIGFGSNKIAVRNADYKANGGSWNAWRAI